MQDASIPPDEQQRLAALYSLNLLDTEPEESFDRITRLATCLYQAPIAMISLVDKDRVWFKSSQGISQREISRAISFCSYVILDEKIFVVPDTLADERFADNPLVTNEPRIRFYAGRTLHAPDGSRVGVLCLMDREPRLFNSENGAMLEDLAGLVEDKLRYRHEATQYYRSEKLQTALYEIAEKTNTTENIEELYRALHAIIEQLMYAENFYIALYDAEKELIHFPYFVDQANSPPSPRPLTEGGLTGYVLQSGQPVWTSKERFAKTFHDKSVVPVGEPAVDWLGVPLKQRDQTFGVLAVQSYTPGIQFHSKEKDLLTFVSHHIATALIRKQAQETQDQYHQQLTQTVKERTARLQSNLGFLETLLNTIPNPVFYKNTEGVYLGCNDIFATQIMGRPRRDIIGRTVYEIPAIPTEVADIYHQQDIELLQEPGVQRYEAQALCADGIWRDFIFSKTTYNDANGEIAGTVGVMVDISDQKQKEEALAQARDQALEAVRLKTRLLANVSHDLRTPLNAIIGYTEMLDEGIYDPLTPKQQVPITNILESAGQLLHFVNNLLNQAQLEAGEISFTLSPFAPLQLSEEAQTIFNSLAFQKEIELITHIDPNLPSTVSGSPYWIRQILTNLISNAIKFTEAGTIRIEFFRADEDHWAIRVADTGPGIPPKAQAYIFEPFQHVDGSITRRHSMGSGLGLSIVKQITQLMEGQISVTSEEGQGSVFTVTLPLFRTKSNPDSS